MKNSMHLLVILALLLSSCNGKKEKENSGNSKDEMNHQTTVQEHDHSHESIVPDAQQVNVKINNSTTKFLEAYLSIREALAQDKSALVAEESEKLKQGFENINPSPKDELSKDIYENILNQVEALIQNKGNISDQRENFENLSNGVKTLVVQLGADRTLFQTYCPMFKDNKGGIWLSSSPEVENPYFGGKMLTCGSVQEVLSTSQSH
ncbi:DUF3347 domain-containing protein [Echinicola jeungdonensis]|uniref:DUF3347 domain-containing protein n=1 Tax=Echinicola jeungdonensis TaxID=709343 RepID=A0ABV5JAZ4_9BACT|nr:DUF3347 domain-containing protein [Echinicola jeungdonensis]MDN3670195.1 DUF3347 domain-containing protein [Echinicola jeungdonensis]